MITACSMRDDSLRLPGTFAAIQIGAQFSLWLDQSPASLAKIPGLSHRESGRNPPQPVPAASWANSGRNLDRHAAVDLGPGLARATRGQRNHLPLDRFGRVDRLAGCIFQRGKRPLPIHLDHDRPLGRRQQIEDEPLELDGVGLRGLDRLPAVRGRCAAPPCAPGGTATRRPSRPCAPENRRRTRARRCCRPKTRASRRPGGGRRSRPASGFKSLYSMIRNRPSTAATLPTLSRSARLATTCVDSFGLGQQVMAQKLRVADRQPADCRSANKTGAECRGGEHRPARRCARVPPACRRDRRG